MPVICIADIADIVNEDANNIIHHGTGDCLTVPNTVVVDMKAWLEGPFVAGQMNDAPCVPPRCFRPPSRTPVLDSPRWWRWWRDGCLPACSM